MQVIYYGRQSRFLSPVNFIYLLRDAEPARWYGPTWCRWIIPGTITD